MNEEIHPTKKSLLMILSILIAMIIIVSISLIVLIDKNTEPEYIEYI